MANPGTRLSELNELAETPAADDQIYILDESETSADKSKRITVVRFLATSIAHIAATIVHGAVSAATASKIVIRDAAGRAKFVQSAAEGDVIVADANNRAPNSTLLEGSNKAAVRDHTPKAHTLVSHSTKPHSALTNVTEAQHHVKFTTTEHSAIGNSAPHHTKYLNSEAKAQAEGAKLDDHATPDDNTDLDASITRHGLLKKLGGGAVNFLRADGAWAEPPTGGNGGGDMYKSTYDTGNNGVVDNSEKLEGSTKSQVRDHTPKAHGIAQHTNVTRELFLAAISGYIYTGTPLQTWDYACVRGQNSVVEPMVHFTFKCPDDFVSYVSIKVVWFAIGEEGDMVCDLDCDYAAEGESGATHQEAPADSIITSVGASKMNIDELPNSLNFTFLTKDDVIGILFTRRGTAVENTLDDVRFLGLIFTYIAEQ